MAESVVTAEGLERDVLDHLRKMSGKEMSDEASAALALAMTNVAISMRLGAITDALARTGVKR